MAPRSQTPSVGWAKNAVYYFQKLLPGTEVPSEFKRKVAELRSSLSAKGAGRFLCGVAGGGAKCLEPLHEKRTPLPQGKGAKEPATVLPEIAELIEALSGRQKREEKATARRKEREAREAKRKAAQEKREAAKKERAAKKEKQKAAQAKKAAEREQRQADKAQKVAKATQKKAQQAASAATQQKKDAKAAAQTAQAKKTAANAPSAADKVQVIHVGDKPKGAPSKASKAKGPAPGKKQPTDVDKLINELALKIDPAELARQAA